METYIIKTIIEAIGIVVLAVIASTQREHGQRITVLEEKQKNYNPEKAKAKLNKMFDEYLSLKKEPSFHDKIKTEEQRMNKTVTPKRVNK